MIKNTQTPRLQTKITAVMMTIDHTCNEMTYHVFVL